MAKLWLTAPAEAPPDPPAGWYSSPTGNNEAEGTFADPFGPMADLLTSTLIEHTDKNGNPVNAGATIKAGDTIWLRGGDHGSVETPVRSWHNSTWLYFKAYSTETPILGQLRLGEIRYWHLEGIEINGDYSTAGLDNADTMLQITNIGDPNSGYVVIKDCVLKGFESADTSSWSASQWNSAMPTGLQIDVPNVTVQGCTFDKFRNGIKASNEGVDISDCTFSFHRSGDCIDILANNCSVIGCTFNGGGLYCSEEHRDMIQIHTGGGANRTYTGPVKNITIRNNIGIASTKNNLPIVRTDNAPWSWPQTGTWTNPTLGSSHSSQSYTHSGQVVTITTASHGLVKGDAVWISSASDATNLPAQTYTVQSIAAGSFTVWAEDVPSDGTLTWQQATYRGPRGMGYYLGAYYTEALNDIMDIFETGQGFGAFDDAIQCLTVENNVFVVNAGHACSPGGLWDGTDHHIKNDDYVGPVIQYAANGYQNSYTHVSTAVTVACTAHGLEAGDSIKVVNADDPTNIPDGWYDVQTVPTVDTFTITAVGTPSDGNLDWTSLCGDEAQEAVISRVRHNTVINPWIANAIVTTGAGFACENDCGGYVVAATWNNSQAYASSGVNVTVTDAGHGRTVNQWIRVKNCTDSTNVPDHAYFQIDTVGDTDHFTFAANGTVSPTSGTLDYHFANTSPTGACDWPTMPGEPDWPGLRGGRVSNNIGDRQPSVANTVAGRDDENGDPMTNSWEPNEVAATYGRSGATVTVTSSTHGLSTSDLIWVYGASDASTIPPQTYQITVTGADTFTFTGVDTGDPTGTLTYDDNTRTAFYANQDTLSGDFSSWAAMFVSPFPSTLDLHLNASASAVGAGLTSEATSTDLDGVSRGDPPDCGAYEYVAP